MPRKSNSSSRIKITFVLVSLCFLAIVSKLIYLQVFQASYLSRQARLQRVTEIPLLAKRGTIYDRNYQQLAVSTEKQTIFATPYLVKKPSLAATKIAPILNKSYEEIYSKLTQKRGFVYLARKIENKAAEKVKALKIDGIEAIEEQQRFWPSGPVACQVLGFVGTDNKGLSGLEMYYDKLLGGRQGKTSDERNALGQTIPGTIKEYLRPINGSNIVITIDREIQYKAQLELEAAVKNWGAKKGSVIVMNPKDGEIYAIANWPSFDITKYSQVDAAATKNSAIVDVYEPGSTLKTFIAATSIDLGIFKPTSMFNLPPTLQVAGATIGEAHGRQTVNYSLTDIIAHSSNVGMSKVGLAVGKENIYSYLRSFGYTYKTGVEFPGEVAGYLPPTSQWYGPTTATVSFGQGISVTAMQLIRGYCVIANGGKLIKPTLVKEIIKPNQAKKITKHKAKKVINPSTSWEMIKMLENVVVNGTGKTAAIPGYKVAGKTGTAQVPDENAKGYAKGRYIASFIGFAPAESASIAAVVVIVEPTKAIYGSAVAAPVFQKVVEFSLQRLKIPPQ
ncbi:MAG: penicillin-binding protein 2 [Actinobacteria bacterium]|nr:MAG: penicillin-binding protein 2 [Actinomycetota bacterium]